MDHFIIFNENIEDFIIKENTTVYQFSKAVGVSGQSVANWLQHNGYPDTESANKIANYLRVSLDFLFGLSLIHILETLASMVRMLEPAARSRLEPIVFIPIMNTVMPPITSNKCVIIVSTIRLYPCRIKYVFNRPKKGGADAPAFPMP